MMMKVDTIIMMTTTITMTAKSSSILTPVTIEWNLPMLNLKAQWHSHSNHAFIFLPLSSS
jgi:hypothetical protein